MHVRLAVAMLVALLASARSTASGQQVAFAASVSAELDSATLAIVTPQLIRARDRGIPVEPLVAKAREGKLKRATGERIRIAVTALATRLDSAKSALGPGSSPDELVAGADAIAAGADLAALRALRAAARGALASPVGTLAQLCASGVAPKRAVEMIVELLKRKATPRQIIALGIDVETDVNSGLLPDESAAVRMRGVEASLGMGDKVELSAPASTTGFDQRPPPRATGKPTRRP